MSEPKIMDRCATDNEYMHKDFHGALCYGIKYIDETFGQDATVEYLRQVANSYYAPLAEKAKSQGISAIEKHFKEIFTKEGGKFDISYQDNVLVIKVDECPAVAHMKKNNQFYTDRYCETTVVVNETICENAGLKCSCKYEPGQGRCIQKFWKP